MHDANKPANGLMPPTLAGAGGRKKEGRKEGRKEGGGVFLGN
jgi:hypothetical protein